MKTFITLCCLLLALAVALPAYADPLASATIVNTLVPPDGATHSYYWTNTTGQMLHIKKANIWLGRAKDMVCDFWALLQIQSTGQLVLDYSQDYYANPTTRTDKTETFAPDDIELGPWDSLHLYTAAVPFDNAYGQPLAAAVRVSIWYTVPIVGTGTTIR